MLTGMAQVSVAQDGIQKLLAAEQEAQQIIAKARKGGCLSPCIALCLATSAGIDTRSACLSFVFWVPGPLRR